MQCSAGHPSTEMIPMQGPARRFRPSFSCPICHRTADFFGTVIERGDFEKEEREYEISADPVGGNEPCLAKEGELPDPERFASHVPDCSNGHPRVPMEQVEQPVACARWFRCPRCSGRKLLVYMALLDEATGKNWLWQNQDQNRRLIRQRASETESLAAESEIRPRGELVEGHPSHDRGSGTSGSAGDRAESEQIAVTRGSLRGGEGADRVPEPDDGRGADADEAASPPPESRVPVAHRRFLHLLVGSLGLFALELLWILSIHPGGSPALPSVYGALFVVGAVAHLWYGREVGDDLSRRHSIWLLFLGLSLAIASWFAPELRVIFIGDRTGLVLWDYFPRIVGGLFFICSGMTGYLSRAW